MSKINVSTAQVGLPVQWVSATQPIDDRSAVQNRSDLLDDVTWQRNGSGPAFVYSGMLTAVVSDNDSNNNGIYYLAKRGNRNDQSWDVNGVDSNSISNYNVNGWRKLLDNTSVLQPVAYDLSISYNNIPTVIYNPFIEAGSIVLGNNVRYHSDQIDSEFISNVQVMDGASLSENMTQYQYTLETPSNINSNAMYMLITSTFLKRYAYMIPAWSSGSGSNTGVETLSDLTDVSLNNSLQIGNVLTYNGSMWVNQAITIPTVPTNVSAFTNDANYITSADIPAQVNSDWNATSGVAKILNKPNLALVATSGDYNDLINTPTIPTVPTNVSAFTNDAGYITSQDQSDWNETDQTSPAYIWNKPNIPASLSIFKCYYNSSNHSMGTTSTQDIINACDNDSIVICESNEILYYLSEHLKSSNGDAEEITFLGFKQDEPQNICWIQYKDGYGWSDGQFNFQSDWNETDQTAHSFIKNKPINISAFVNDANYITAADVPAQVNADWDASTGIAAILHKPTIPTTTSQLTNDSGYITVNQIPSQIQSDWAETNSSSVSYIQNRPHLATVATSGDYADLSHTPTIPVVPSNVSSFTNDAGYLTQSDLNGLIVFVCNYNTATGIMDKTAAEIVAAHTSGKTVLCQINDGTNSLAYLAMCIDPSHIVFTSSLIKNRTITTLTCSNPNTGSWELDTISLDDSTWQYEEISNNNMFYNIEATYNTKHVVIDNSNNVKDVQINFPVDGNTYTYYYNNNKVLAGECALLHVRHLGNNRIYYELVSLHK